MFRFWLVLLCVGALTACRPHGPVDFPMGTHACEHCRMTIVDPRFRTEIISPKGKIYRFDAIECLVQWSATHTDHVGTQWVSDFANPTTWIALDQAYILHSPTLASPMGAFLSAYATSEEFAQAQRVHGGERVTVEQLPNVVRAGP